MIINILYESVWVNSPRHFCVSACAIGVYHPRRKRGRRWSKGAAGLVRLRFFYDLCVLMMEQTDLKSILQGRTKLELADIGQVLGLDMPRLRTKAGMVSALDKYLRTRPSEWLSHLLERDLEELETLVETGPDKYRSIEYADYPSTLEILGLVDVIEGDENSDVKQVRLPKALYDIAAPHIRSVRRQGEKDGRYAFERVALGYLNLYGVLPFEEFIDRMYDYLEPVTGSDVEKMRGILAASPVLKIFRTYDEKGEGDYVCSPCIDKLEYILEDWEHFNVKEFKHFTPEDALDAGTGAPYFTPGLKTPEGIALETALRRAGYSGYDLVKAIYDIWICAQSDADFDALFYSVEQRMEHFASESNYYEALHAVEDYANSVPKWSLGGKSADETGLMRVSADIEDPSAEYPEEDIPIRWEMPRPTISEGYSDLIEKDAALEALSKMMPSGFPFGMAIPHVAQDDPCPCGSGLKYGQCHGKHLS